MTDVELSIVIISYNTAEMTVECIRSIYKETKNINFEIIILDNNSSDRSVAAISTEFPDVKLIANKDNVGFACGNNLAAKEANGKYILLLNPDTVVLEHAIEKLLLFAKSRPNDGIYGGRTYLGDGTLVPASVWRKPSLWGIFCFAVGLTVIFKRNKYFDPQTYGSWKLDDIREVDILEGSFFLLSKKIWDELKGFSPDFFMYAEEDDLCLRAIELGVQPVFYPDAKIIHYGGASDKVLADKMVRLLKSKITLLQKHWKNTFFVLLGAKLYLLGTFIRAWNPVGIFSPSEKVLQWREIWNRRDQWASGK